MLLSNFIDELAWKRQLHRLPFSLTILLARVANQKIACSRRSNRGGSAKRCEQTKTVRGGASGFSGQTNSRFVEKNS